VPNPSSTTSIFSIAHLSTPSIALDNCSALRLHPRCVGSTTDPRLNSSIAVYLVDGLFTSEIPHSCRDGACILATTEFEHPELSVPLEASTTNAFHSNRHCQTTAHAYLDRLL
jgi:hypothetical protein